MKVAFLSNVNMNMLQSFLSKGNSYYFPDGYDMVFQELTDTNSGLYCNAPDALFVFPHFQSAIEKYGAYFREEFSNSLLDLIIRYAEKNPQTRIFVSEMIATSLQIEPLNINNSAIHIAEWNYNIYSKSNQIDNLFVFPMQMMIAQSKDEFFSDKLNYLGKIPFSIFGQKKIAEQVDCILNALSKKRKKCLLLDLDNTLWGGVIGEDGLAGIKLSNDGEGKPYYDSQLRIKAIKDTGILLAIVSKNNLEDAMLPFEKHEYCPLKKADFAICKANWNEKTDNIEAIAQELNIGLDSMVFLDDNNVEREKVKTALPQVTVAEFPKDITMLPALLEQVYNRYFFVDSLTAEDIEKTKSYQIEQIRVKQRESAQDLQSYIKGLQIKIDLHPIRSNELERVAQLTQKTNQFNLTTQRFTINELKVYLSKIGNEIYVANVKDRYGDYGLVMVIMLTYENSHVHIDNILMSCRVMGRDVENSVMHEIAKQMSKRGVTEWAGKYMVSPKNAPVCNLYDSWGFEASECDGGKVYHAKKFKIENTLCEVIYDR